jgi:hypothetical protein
MQEKVSEAFRSSKWELGVDDPAEVGRPCLYAVRSLEHPVVDYSVEIVVDADDIATNQETTAVARLFHIDAICTTRVAEAMRQVAGVGELKVFCDEFLYSARRWYQPVGARDNVTNAG